MEQIIIFSGVLKALVVTAAKNDARQFLCGVYVEQAGDYALLVTTDAHRMSIARTPYSGEAFAPFVIRREMIDNLKAKKFVSISCDDNIVKMEADGITQAMPVQDGRFPEHWRQVVPTELSNEAARFQPSFYADLGKIRKLLGFKEYDHNLVTNGKSAAIDAINDDFMTLIMPFSDPKNSLEPTTAPSWFR